VSAIAKCKCLPAIVLLCGLSACSTPKPQTGQMSKEFEIKKTGKIQYLLFLPAKYHAQPERRWPLILFLHGAGERGTDIWKVATHGPPRNVRQEPDFPFIVVSPQCPEDEVWSNGPLLDLLQDVSKKYAVDSTRIYLTGLSMGGYGTWDLGLAHPELFAAIAPICGGGELINPMLSSRHKPQALKSLGVWAFHGAKDPVVPLEESERMVNILKKLEVQDVSLTVYPEALHDSWTQTYNNPELYKWLLKHERKPASQAN
jgi:predicted peptidase